KGVGWWQLMGHKKTINKILNRITLMIKRRDDGRPLSNRSRRLAGLLQSKKKTTPTIIFNF
ncbi:hypothetical protein M2T53_28580, partial [Klebsiella pneumoniae]|nr:hypothetical protein [Klebsiella pneumoniae]